MKFFVQIDVMPLKNLLDPQGKAVTMTLKNLGYKETDNVRIGKHIDMTIDATDETAAKQTAEEIARKVLSNPIMEYFSLTVKAENN